MNNSINRTSSAQAMKNSDILQTMIPSSTTQEVVLPYITTLSAGKYSSKIVAVAEAVQNNVVVGIDCTHKLTSYDGNITVVKFRFFEPIDTSKLIQVLASYGLSGNIGSALLGLNEIVEVAQRPNSNRYMYIARRTQSSAYDKEVCVDAH